MAGSRFADVGDAGSDIDMYVYAAEPVPVARRGAIAARFASRLEIGNAFWEPGDEWIDAETGVHVDVMYRTPDWIEEHLERVLVRREASLGYSTCFWHNVLNSTPLCDRTGWYRRLQTTADRPYPEALKRAIVARNHPVLRHSLSSYLHQIERAVQRGDSVSVQHRVTALLASYFDILFAVNGLPHPGEKRQLLFAMTRCERRPPEMERHLNALLQIAPRPATPAILAAVNPLLDDLDSWLMDQGLLRATS